MNALAWTTRAAADWRRHLTLWKAILATILAFGLYATVIRFSQGLGAATNLSDAFPWGLWIGFDVLVGVGLAAGGFVVAATVHIFGMKKYEPVARPAVLTAFLGYLLVIVALLFDLGRPYRIWHPLVMWNPRSVMFEVAWCVTLYTTVLALEFSPLVLERLGWKRALRVMRKVFVPLVIVGVLLSTMHQSSLGTLYVIAPDKLHSLWYTPLLPVFFFLSAIGAGLAMTIFESFMSFRAFGKRLEKDILRGLGRAIVVVLATYTVWRFEDLAARGALAAAFQFTPESVLFWGEIGLGAILPAVLLSQSRVRRSESGLFFAAMLTIMGFIVNRLNVAITGMAASSGVAYLPSLNEFAVTMSIVALGFVAFGLAVRWLPVFPPEELITSEREALVAAETRAMPAVNRRVLAALWGLLLLGTAGYAVTSAHTAKAAPEPPAPVAAAAFGDAVPLRLPEPYLFPTSDKSPGPVFFEHENHVDPGMPQCAACHPRLFHLLEPGLPAEGEVTMERVHQGDLCASCHDGEQAFGVLDDCELCHRPQP